MDKLLRAALAATELGALYEGVRARPRHIILAVVLGWIAAMFGILALLWFDAALWFYCLPRLGPPIAALIAGGALLLAALIAVLVILLTRQPSSQSAPVPGLGAGIDARALARELTGFVREHRGAILIASALAGVILGSNQKR